ncbi:MAG: ABC transporter ATP-binding protein [Actinomycetota bacterium]
MTPEPIVSLRDVGKQYVKYEDAPTLISRVARRPRRNRRSKLWALRHVSLDVKQGESLGVVGRNGAGKSTMLAMLAGVTAPTEGVVTVRGRVAPLLRLGVGFSEELTGRENVYINGTILGLSEQQIDRLFDEILAFAELEDFIDTPVKFYSSGMQARLGFSVAVASRPDVLIVDEVLAVGDMPFQLRSFDRMLELQKEGATILVVSHNLDSVRRVCSRVLVLNRGETYFEGEVEEGIGRYHELLRVNWEDVAQAGGADGAAGNATDAPLEVVGVELLDADGASSLNFESQTQMTVRLHVRVKRAVTDPICGLWLTNQANVLVYRSASVGQSTGRFEPGTEAFFDVELGLHLVGGTYTIASWVGWDDGGIQTVRAPAMVFYVSSIYKRGVANLGASYQVTRMDPNAPDVTDNPAIASDPRAL